ncbi:hypothetical protein J2S74_000980 [Evansella vedderi]|uniref:Polyketide cyclase / dehydrase and lipid transport n=1 Tax=Evansella vedderi TaxID=38282 RepID=A0ABT9ZQU3_9BACI|nr:SRPBCC family protein [Evansella vedderi]MDQ0253608.1 hypothetical protein [Evansella vedderi]
MADLHEETIIDKPLSDIYPFLANPENRTEIFTNVVKVEKLTNSGGEAGSRYKEVRQLSPTRKVASELEILEVVPNKKISFFTESNALKVEYIYTFEEVEEGTKVVFEGTVQTNSLRTKIMRPFLVNMVRKEDGDNLLSVKKALDS